MLEEAVGEHYVAELSVAGVACTDAAHRQAIGLQVLNEAGCERGSGDHAHLGGADCGYLDRAVASYQDGVVQGRVSVYARPGVLYAIGDLKESIELLLERGQDE